MNCLDCKFCRWLECTNEEITDEEYEKVEKGEECPYFVPYWAEERNPYEPVD